MTGLYKPTDQIGQPLNTIYAEDIWQFTDVFTGNRDGGALTLLGPVTDPTAFSPTMTLLAGGVLTGAYKWAFYWITGTQDGTLGTHIVGRTLKSTPSGTQNPSSQKGQVSISGITVPTGVIGWGVCRTLAGGSTYFLVPGSEQFLSAALTMPATYVDNTADGSLVTLVQSTNTTGTSLAGVTTPAGTTFPSTPIDGQEYVYVADGTNGVFWRFRYYAAGGYWAFIGGPPLYSFVAAGQSTSSAGYTDLATVGPQLVLPFTGDWDIAIGALMSASAASDDAIMNFSIGGGAPINADQLIQSTDSTGAVAGGISVARMSRKTGLSAVTVTAKYLDANANSATFSSRWMAITPVKH